MIRRCHKSIAQAKKDYEGWPTWKQTALKRAVYSSGVVRTSDMLTHYTLRQILGKVTSKSVWLDGELNLSAEEMEEEFPDSDELKNMAISILGAEYLLQEDSERMSASIIDSGKRFSNWLWQILTVRPNGKNLTAITAKELNALAVICYEDTLDVAMMCFDSTSGSVSAHPPKQTVLRLSKESIMDIARKVISQYSHEDSTRIGKEDFMVAADLIAKIYRYRGDGLLAVGKYEVKKTIGSGASGVVRLGRDFTTGQRVALKSYNRHDAGEELTPEVVMGNNMDVESVLKIYESVLPYPNITELKDVIITESHIHLVYHFCSGGSVFDLLSYKRADVSEHLGCAPNASPILSPRTSMDEKHHRANGHRTKLADELSTHDCGTGNSVERCKRNGVECKNGLPRRGSFDHRSRVLGSLRMFRHMSRATNENATSDSEPEWEANVGPLATEEEAKMIIRSLAGTVDWLHKKHICHRDIQLRNLLYTSSNKVQLADFDTATYLAPGWDLLDGEVIVGSLYYLAPEQVIRQAYSGFPADMWSIGVCMYWLLRGRPPFIADTTEGVFSLIRKGVYEPLIGVSAEATDVIHSLLNPDPASRLSSKMLVKSPWLQHADMTTTFRNLIYDYEYESPVELQGQRHMYLAGKLIESILADAGTHHISIEDCDKWEFRCILPEHDIKFTIFASVRNGHGLLEFKLLRGQGLVFVKASRKISKVWSNRLQGLIFRWPRGDSAELEHALDLKMNPRSKSCASRLRRSLKLPPFVKH